jgi:hypothetical protein
LIDLFSTDRTIRPSDSKIAFFAGLNTFKRHKNLRSIGCNPDLDYGLVDQFFFGVAFANFRHRFFVAPASGIGFVWNDFFDRLNDFAACGALVSAWAGPFGDLVHKCFLPLSHFIPPGIDILFF